MSQLKRSLSPARRISLAGVACLALAGCGSSAGLGVKTVAVTSSSAMTSSAGMNMGASTTAMTVDGIKAVPTQTLATAEWQGMKVSARAMTAVPFVIFDGTTERTVKPPKDTSFHLMVMLNDAHTNVPIPYAGVWATIRKAGKIVYDERQWPMLSEYMGPHYGNNVSLPGGGHYELSLLISPPVSARHVEYKNVWLHPHRVNVTFSWNARS
jgi:uncharacterized protein involved in high-affinity Fe2+ transport